MTSVRFSDEQWKRIWRILRRQPGICVRREVATRRFVEAVLWIARAGCAWRLVPEERGDWNTVYKRFGRWQVKGVWQALLKAWRMMPIASG